MPKAPPAKKIDKKAFRVLDANFNRSREGLRVCEDIARFIFEDRKNTLELKAIRHAVTQILLQFPKHKRLLELRESDRDIGKDLRLAGVRKGWRDVFQSNLERVKESMRVLEEFSRLIDKNTARKLERLRFRLYGLEKKILLKVPRSC